MASPRIEDWRDRSIEPGWPSGAKPKPDRVWSLWKSGTLAHAEIGEHRLGYELRMYMSGGFVYGSAHPTRQAAEREARKLKREERARGWTDRLEHSYDGLK
jgi:hypothetical protein